MRERSKCSESWREDKPFCRFGGWGRVFLEIYFAAGYVYEILIKQKTYDTYWPDYICDYPEWYAVPVDYCVCKRDLGQFTRDYTK